MYAKKWWKYTKYYYYEGYIFVLVKWNFEVEVLNVWENVYNTCRHLWYVIHLCIEARVSLRFSMLRKYRPEKWLTSTFWSQTVRS